MNHVAWIEAPAVWRAQLVTSTDRHIICEIHFVEFDISMLQIYTRLSNMYRTCPDAQTSPALWCYIVVSSVGAGRFLTGKVFGLPRKEQS